MRHVSVHALERQPKRRHRALETLKEVRRHQALNALLATGDRDVAVFVLVLPQPARQNVPDGHVNRKLKPMQARGDGVIRGGRLDRGQVGTQADGFVALREGPDGRSIVVALDVIARACNRHLVEHAEEIEIERVRERFGGALLGVELGPFGERRLSAAEHVLHVRLEPQALRPLQRVALIRQRKLIAQVTEPIVHRRGRQHEHLGGHAVAHHAIQQRA